MEQATGRIGNVPVPIGDLWNPWTCPPVLLSWLAWALSVDEWDSAWPDEIKRQTIADSLELHRHKGTPWAVKRALEMTGFPSTKLQEWYEYGGSPGYFQVAIDLLETGIDQATWDKLDARIERYKNKRSWLQYLNLWLTGMGVSNHALTCQGGEMLTVWPYRTTTIEQYVPGYHAIGMQTVETVTVNPQTS
jgi:phage tail P2-like protein